jgi:hypothetical protein
LGWQEEAAGLGDGVFENERPAESPFRDLASIPPEPAERRLPIQKQIRNRAARWSGRLEDLDPEQLDNYMASLKCRIEGEERRLPEQQKQLEAGPVVDIQATESSTTA